MKKILFLGYSKKKTKLVDEIKFFNKKILVKKTIKKVNLETINKYDVIISFGYKHLISEKIIRKSKKPMINLHIGYLPYNRGAHPNYWSFAENTPSGVSIHKIDGGVDTGKIIYQKFIDFDLFKNRKVLTFESTYKTLINEIEDLFLQNIRNLIDYNFSAYNQIGKGTYHSSKDLPKILKSWKQNIYKTIVEYNNSKNKELEKKIEIISKIENTRKSNNVNWMNIVRNSLKNSPKETMNILNKINFDDRRISELFKLIVKK